ncbi:MAG TPA: hypothetical protein VG318_18640 [Actinomycetota bacterium]|nr:hypothetical protein [Actinomycetota bacterium]
MVSGDAVSQAVEHKDVVLAFLGASAGLSGLILVFLGLVISTYQSFPGSTPEKVLARYKRVAATILVAFALGIACVGLATAWLLKLGTVEWLYVATGVVFVAQIIALVVATASTAHRLLWSR